MSKKLTITLVRHGETLANRNNIMQGQINTDLSDIGQAQAQLVGARLMDEHFTLAFSSDLNRASDTAKAIIAANKTSSCRLELMKELRERNYGWLEGKPLSQFQKVVRDLNVSMQEYMPEGGESIPQVTQRARQFFYYLCETMMKISMPHGSDEEAQKELWSTSLPSDNILTVNVGSDDAAEPCRNSVCSQFEIGTPGKCYDLLGEEHVLVVSHELWLREFKNAILSHYKGDKLATEEMKKQATQNTPNTGVCKFELIVTLFEKKLHVNCTDILLLNDVSHLQRQSADLASP